MAVFMRGHAPMRSRAMHAWGPALAFAIAASAHAQSVVEISGTTTGSALTTLVNAKPAGPVIIRPVPGQTATVTGGFSPPRAQVTIDGVNFTGVVNFGPGDDGSQLLNSRAQGFSIGGADDVVIRGNRFDGEGTILNNEIWRAPCRSAT